MFMYLCQVLSTRLIEDQPGKENLHTIKLYEGSISEFNPGLRGVDVAVCIEVLSPDILQPLLMRLFALSPRMFLFLVFDSPTGIFNLDGL